MKLGLVLSGGGSRAVFSLGCVKYFEEIGLEFEAYSGASGGSIAATLLASGLSAQKSFEIIKQTDFKKYIRYNIFSGSIFRFQNEKELLESILPFRNIQELPKPLYINAVDFETGVTNYFHSGDITSAILSSCSLYPLFKPYEKDGKIYIDGGFTNNLPYEPLKEKVDKIIAINVNPLWSVEYKKLGMIKKLKRILMFLFYANIATRVDQVDLFIEPKAISKFNILDTSCFDECFNMGYQHAKSLNLGKFRNWFESWDDST